MAPISPCCGPGWENRPRCGGALPAAAAAIAAANRGGMSPAPGGTPCTPWPPNKAKDGGKSGRADNRNFSISASWRRFAFALLFWNQIFTYNGTKRQPRSFVDHLKVCIICGTVMSTIWLVFPTVWRLFSIKIHGVLGINTTVVLKMIHTMYMESVVLLSSVTCSYAGFRDAPTIWCKDGVSFLCSMTELCKKKQVPSTQRGGCRISFYSSARKSRSYQTCDVALCTHFINFWLACGVFWERKDWDSLLCLAVQNNIQTNINHCCPYGIIKWYISPVAGLEWPRGFQEVKVPRFHDNGTG